jgi:hypothetical protein
MRLKHLSLYLNLVEYPDDVSTPSMQAPSLH